VLQNEHKNIKKTKKWEKPPKTQIWLVI
jgi:hypothetical protein